MIFGLAAIAFVAFSVEASAGFGSLMISLAIAALFWPIAEVMPIFVPISLGLSIYMLARYWRLANWPLLGRAVLPLMLLGTCAGMFLVPSASPALLRVLLGVVVTAAAARGLWCLQRAPSGRRPMRLTSLLWVAVAGVMHGMIATGGPALVYALEGAGMDKRSFRSTLAVVWFVLNLVLTLRFLQAGTLALAQGKILLMLLPVIALAVVTGEQLHSRVSERVFRMAVFYLLIVLGVLLWAPIVWALL